MGLEGLRLLPPDIDGVANMGVRSLCTLLLVGHCKGLPDRTCMIWSALSHACKSGALTKESIAGMIKSEAGRGVGGGLP